MAEGFRFTGTLIPNLRTMDERVQRGVVAAAHWTAPQAETFMKNNASWTDRTGNARNGLGARVVLGPDTVAIVLYHSVPYGVFLEVRWGGKYAIIEPTMAATGPIFLSAIKRLAFNQR